MNIQPGYSTPFRSVKRRRTQYEALRTQPLVSISRTARPIVFALLSIALSSCAVQLYEGDRPSNEISTIFHSGRAKILEVDGKEVYGFKAELAGQTGPIKLLPGMHTVTAVVPGFLYKGSRLLGRVYETTGRATLNWDAKAGKTYLVNGRHGGPTGWRIWIAEIIPDTSSTSSSKTLPSEMAWIYLPIPTTVAVAGNAPPANITGDKDISLPFVTSVSVYSKKVVLHRGASFCPYSLCREIGVLTIRDDSVTIEEEWNKQESLTISKANIRGVKLEEFFSPAEAEPPSLIEAIFLHYVESGENKVIALTNTPSDTEQDSYLYSALLRITKTVP